MTAIVDEVILRKANAFVTKVVSICNIYNRAKKTVAITATVVELMMVPFR